jgi:hypothetical protein
VKLVAAEWREVEAAISGTRAAAPRAAGRTKTARGKK